MRKMIKMVSFTLMALFSGAVAWGYPMPTAWEMKIHNFEMVSNPAIPWNPNGPALQTFTGLADGKEDNWGIAKITSIIDRSDASVKWSSGTNGEYLSLIFGGLDVYKIVASDTTGFGVPDTFKIFAQAATWADLNNNGRQDTGEALAGTFFDVYKTPTELSSAGGPGLRTSPTGYTGITDVGVLQGKFVLGSGASLVDPNALTVINSDSLTDPLTGNGNGFADAVPGSGPLADIVDTNGFPTNFGFRDIVFQFNFRPHPDLGQPDYGWTINSEDPIRGAAVPEPSTVLLLGAGLVGLGGFARRRAKK